MFEILVQFWIYSIPLCSWYHNMNLTSWVASFLVKLMMLELNSLPVFGFRKRLDILLALFFNALNMLQMLKDLGWFFWDFGVVWKLSMWLLIWMCEQCSYLERLSWGFHIFIHIESNQCGFLRKPYGATPSECWRTMKMTWNLINVSFHLVLLALKMFLGWILFLMMYEFFS